MRTLGKFVVMTKGELDKIKDLAYLRGLRSKWKAKKNQSFVDDILAANRGDITTPVGKILNGAEDDTEALLSAIGDSVVIPRRAA